MRNSLPVRLAVVAVPPLVLAAAGLTHPGSLTAESADTWRDLHIGLLPVFPLLALAPWLVARRGGRAPSWITAVLGYAYAAFYTALDVLAGIGAGTVRDRVGETAAIGALFSEGNELAEYGVWAFLAATVVAAFAAVRQGGAAAGPGAVLVVLGATLFLDSHIYWPRGGLAMLALAAGWAAIVWATSRGSVRREPVAVGAAP